jgi:hypothetical protein
MVKITAPTEEVEINETTNHLFETINIKKKDRYKRSFFLYKGNEELDYSPVFTSRFVFFIISSTSVINLDTLTSA